MENRLMIIAARSAQHLVRGVCRNIGSSMRRGHVRPANVTIFNHDDGEVYVKSIEDVREADVFVLCSPAYPQWENYGELLEILDMLKRSSARRVTVVLAYYAYACQDRKDEGRVPISAKLIADLITAAGPKHIPFRIMTIDLHSGQIQGFFDMPVDHLYGSYVLVPALRERSLRNLCVLLPDTGANKRGSGYARILGARHIALVEKERLDPSKGKEGTQIRYVAGTEHLDGSTTLITDDLTRTAGGIVNAAKAAKEYGARRVIVAVTHFPATRPGLFEKVVRKIADAPIDHFYFTDTIALPCNPRDLPAKFHLVTVKRMLGRAIGRVHRGRSISDLFLVHKQ